MLHTPDVDGYRPGAFARLLKYLQRKLLVKNTHLLPSFFAYFVDLHRPVKGGGKPDSKVFIGVHPLHTSVFNVERCNGEG